MNQRLKHLIAEQEAKDKKKKTIKLCNSCKINETCGQFIKGNECHFMLLIEGSEED